MGPSQRYYTPREVADALGISKQTLLRYEQRGIFPPAQRNAVNGWREYTSGDVDRLKRVLHR